MGLDVLGYAACGQVSEGKEKEEDTRGIICSVPTQVDTRRLRRTAEDIQSHGSSGSRF